MTSQDKIRTALAAIYPLEEAVACQIFRDWEGWQVQPRDRFPRLVGRTLRDALQTLQSLAATQPRLS